MTAAIVAGGRATRMGGRPKGLLVHEGQTIVGRQLAVLSRLADELLIVTGDSAYAGLGARLVPDLLPGAEGPLVGIYSALCAAGEEAVLVVACDMPALDERALRLVRDADPRADVALVRPGGLAEPLHARYHRRCAGPMRAFLESGERKAQRFLEQVGVTEVPEAALRAIDPALSFLRNVNRPEDLDPD